MSAEPETSKKGLAKLDQLIEFRDPASRCKLSLHGVYTPFHPRHQNVDRKYIVQPPSWLASHYHWCHVVDGLEVVTTYGQEDRTGVLCVRACGDVEGGDQ
jgi:hypothetical protein